MNAFADQRAHDVARMTAAERDTHVVAPSAAELGCACRLGPDCPRPGQCDGSALEAEAAMRERAAAELAAEFGTDVSEWTV